MLGITTHITSDLSPIPLFWLVPLILYLASFILVFARWPVVWVEQPHSYMVLAQPFGLAFMVLVDALHLSTSPEYIPWAIVGHVLGFFLTTMVCHGELAKDRPSTKHLTEFYLMMSVGGMLGGMFNALIAPVVFKKIWELPLAIFAAALVRPKMADVGLGDNWIFGLLEGQPDKQAAPAGKAGHKGPKAHQAPVHHTAVATESFVKTLDWAWPIGITILMFVFMITSFVRRVNLSGSATIDIVRVLLGFLIPLALCCMCMARPIRIGFGLGGIMFLTYYFHQREDSIYSARSYFGTISVTEDAFRLKLAGDKFYNLTYHQLVHGTTLHGQNFIVPPVKGEKGEPSDRGNPEKDWSRLANTYYHRFGPTGQVMEKFNWWHGQGDHRLLQNTYDADARMPASLIGQAVAELGTGTMPLTNFVTLWSEPPYATVGLGTGTMASYGRPYQHVHFYEIDNQILRLSLLKPTREIYGRDTVPGGKRLMTPFEQYQNEKANSTRKLYNGYLEFNYLERALERGSIVQVMMGDARLRMALPYYNHYLREDAEGKPVEDRGGGPENFYHMMVVDAFSSDAIPAHLLTKEALQMYFGRLTEKGILCVHTSNKFANLAKVASSVATDLGYAYKRGHDNLRDASAQMITSEVPLSTNTRGPSVGHSTSEWVMIARKAEYLNFEGDSKDPTYSQPLAKFYQDFNKYYSENARGEYWDTVPFEQRCVWTDDYYNLLSVVRFLREKR